MKNLKRALSFALATVMVIGMMVVGAGAAFTDADKIENTDAVNTMVALNVLNGKGDGSYFDPTGTLTRAEAAKIIVYVLHGGKAPIIGTKATPTYSDIKGNWAEAYIEYCSAQGIIAGYNGLFTPAGELTGSAFAKMLMVAMGYNADVFGFVGSDWEINVNIEANKIGLYEDLDDIDPAKTISRDDAAQMAYNALFAGIMKKDYTHNLETGVVTNGYTFYTNTDLFAEKFDGVKAYGYIVNVDYDSTEKEYTYTLTNNGTNYGGTVISQTTEDGLKITTIKSEDDYSALFGQKVAVVYKDATVDVLYGIYSEATEIVAGTVGQVKAPADVTTKSAKIGDVEYKLTNAFNATKVVAFNNDEWFTADMADLGGANKYDNFVVYDNTGDGKGDVAVWTPVTVAKVTHVGTQTITAGAVSYSLNKDNGLYVTSPATVNYKFPTVAKNDYVAYELDVVDGASIQVEVVETLTAKVTGLDDTNDKALVDGNWYTYTFADSAIALNNTYKFQVVNGYLYAAELKDTAATDILYAVKADKGLALSGLAAEVMFTDGVKEVISISKIDGVAVTNGTELTCEVLYTFEKKDTGKYEIKTVNALNEAGFDGYKTYSAGDTYVAATTSAAAKFDTQLIADDAVIFVKSVVGNKTTTSVISGAELKTYTNTTTSAAGQYLIGSANGLASVKVATMFVNTAIGTKTQYGYVLTTPYATKVNNVDYQNYDLWTVNGKVSVQDDNTNAVSKGDFVSYTTNTNGSISSTIESMTDSAIIGYNATDAIITVVDDNGALIIGANEKLDKDVVYLYVDSKNVAGVESGEIALAEKTAEGKYILNAWTLNDGSDFELIVVDVANNLYVDAANDGTDDITECGYAIAELVKNIPSSWTATATERDYACEGETITVTVKVPATAGASSITLTATGAASVSPAGTVAHPGSAAATYVFTVTVGAAPITALSVG